MESSVLLCSFLEEYQIKSNKDLHRGKDLKNLVNEVQSHLYGCIFCSKSRALSLLIMFRSFQYVLNLFSLYLLCSAIMNWCHAVNFWPIKGKHFKLQFEETSDIHAYHIDMMFASLTCRWPRPLYNESISGRERIFSFQNAVKITGLAYHDITMNKNRITGSLSASNKGSTRQLKDIGLSLYRSFDGERWDKLEPSWHQSRSALQPEAIDLRPPMWWILHSVISPLALAIYSFTASRQHVRSSFRSGARLLSWGWLIASATHLISCLCGAPLYVAHSCVLSSTYAALSFIEYGILEGCLVVWSFEVAVALYDSRIQPASYSDRQIIYPVTGCFFILAILIWRDQFRKTLRDCVRRDRVAFDAAFAHIRDDPALPRLAAACDRIAAPLLDTPAPTSLKQPTRCVSQLWDQAAALQIILDSKAESWALSSCGTLAPADEGPSAVELFALLDGDPALLFDYCASGVVFEDIGCLTTCLKLVQADRSVRILRVENGFSSAWSADREGGSGYRWEPTRFILCSDSNTYLGTLACCHGRIVSLSRELGLQISRTAQNAGSCLLVCKQLRSLRL
jgi:hypothetical protein